MWYATYDDVGRDFRADLGFMPRVDFTFLLGGIKRVWRGEDGDGYNLISLGGDADRSEDQSGQVLEEEYEIFFDYEGPKQSEVSARFGTKERFFNGVLFDERFVNLSFEIQPTGKATFSLFARVSDDIDFANTRPGDLLRLAPEVRYDFGHRLRINLEHDYRRLDVDGGTLFTANLSQLRAVYQLNLRTFFRGIFQYTDIERDPSLFEEDVEARDERLLSQLLFSYKINPQTVLFLGYSDTSLGGRDPDRGDLDLTRANRTFFLKIGYAWVL